MTVPRVVQMKNAAIMMYKPKGLQWLLSGGRTHAWFPKAAFDQGDEWSFGAWKALDCNVDTGRWIFGRVGKGYVGLFSAQRPKWTTDGDWKDKEIIADGDRNVFILQVGSEEGYGVVRSVHGPRSNARIHVNGLNWEALRLRMQLRHPAHRPRRGRAWFRARTASSCITTTTRTTSASTASRSTTTTFRASRIHTSAAAGCCGASTSTRSSAAAIR